jgi:hypothetical protein
VVAWSTVERIKPDGEPRCGEPSGYFPPRFQDLPMNISTAVVKPLAALGVVALLVLSSCTSPRPRPVQATFEKTGEALVLTTPRWAMAIDAGSGAIRWIEDRSAAGTLMRGGDDLWVIERHDAPAIPASAGAFSHAWNPKRNELTLNFDAPDAAVTIVCKATDEGPEWRSQVAMKQGRMTGWRFPASLAFDVTPMRQFIFPEHLGLAFTRKFFEPGGAGVERHALHGKGLERVAGDRCRMAPVVSEPVAVKPG